MDLSTFGLVPYASRSAGVGQIFGRLTVCAVGKIPDTFKYMAVCRCACGAFPVIAQIGTIKNGQQTSCGCQRLEKITTHGQSKNPLYAKWQAMMGRCYRDGVERYTEYGGRGITVCERWHRLEHFISDMQKGYKTGLELDRIDPHGNYEPGNCRWATHAEQANNKTNNVNIEHKGRTQTLSQWANEIGLKPSSLWKRINILKWPVDRALEAPLRKKLATRNG